MEWPTLFAAGGLAITVATILVGLGATLQKLRSLQAGQDTLFMKVEELQRDLKNGITKRLGEHSGEIDVLKMGLVNLEKVAHSEIAAVERNIERQCALRHGGRAAG